MIEVEREKNVLTRFFCNKHEATKKREKNEIHLYSTQILMINVKTLVAT
jgi:hypothetical protein